MKNIATATLLGLLPFAAFAQAPPTGPWTYEYADLQYGRHRTTFVISRGDPSDAEESRYVVRPMGAGKMLPEYLPRALQGGAAPAAWPTPSGYPTYATPYLEWSYTVKAMDWENVTVPAGTFRALKVEIQGTRGKDPDPFWWPKQAMRFVHTIWYAPDAGRYIKARHRAWAMTDNLFADDVVELIEAKRD